MHFTKAVNWSSETEEGHHIYQQVTNLFLHYHFTGRISIISNFESRLRLEIGHIALNFQGNLAQTRENGKPRLSSQMLVVMTLADQLTGCIGDGCCSTGDAKSKIFQNYCKMKCIVPPNP